MNVLQRITISGKHWDDIIALPCFLELNHCSPAWNVVVYANYVDGKAQPHRACCRAWVGDSIVQYDNHKWGVESKYYMKNNELGL